MKMEYIFEPGSGAVNEDFFIAHEHCFGVFDGATSLNPVDPKAGPSGGARASAIAGQTFENSDQSLAALAELANKAIGQEMKSCGLDFSSRCQLWSTSAAVVRINNSGLEWFQTGDAQIIFIDHNGDYQVAAPALDHDYPTLTMIKAKGRHHPQVQQKIQSIREDMNRSYGVLNGEPGAKKFFSTGTQKLAGLKTILLFTDGLEIPCAQPQKIKDFSSLVHMSQELGLQGVHDYVRHKEQADPQIKAFPRFKIHDDMTAIALHL